MAGELFLPARDVAVPVVIFLHGRPPKSGDRKALVRAVPPATRTSGCEKASP